jgi:hypothetical protein
MTWTALQWALTLIGMRPNNSTRSMLFAEMHAPGVCVHVSDMYRCLKSRLKECKNMLDQSCKHGTVL